MENEYDEAIRDARATALKYNITEEDINAEIRTTYDSTAKTFSKHEGHTGREGS